MDQRALQMLLIYRWHCIKGTPKPYGNFAVKEAFKCPINYLTPVKWVYNVSDILILFKKLDLEFKMDLPMSTTGPSKDLGELLEAQTFIKMLPDCSPMS